MAEQAWTCTRTQLAAALAAIMIRPVQLPGRGGVVLAEDMAAAILEQLPHAGHLEPRPPVSDLASLALPGLTGAEADAFTGALTEHDGLNPCSRCNGSGTEPASEPPDPTPAGATTPEPGTTAGAGAATPEAGLVTVSCDDLVTVLAAADAFIGAEPAESAFRRLSAAAGVQ